MQPVEGAAICELLAEQVQSINELCQENSDLLDKIDGLLARMALLESQVADLV